MTLDLATVRIPESTSKALLDLPLDQFLAAEGAGPAIEQALNAAVPPVAPAQVATFVTLGDVATAPELPRTTTAEEVNMAAWEQFCPVALDEARRSTVAFVSAPVGPQTIQGGGAVVSMARKGGNPKNTRAQKRRA